MVSEKLYQEPMAAPRKAGLAGLDGDRTPRAASSLRSASAARPSSTTPRVPQQPSQPSARVLGKERPGSGGIGGVEAAGASSLESRKRARTGTRAGTVSGTAGQPLSSTPASGSRATFRTPAPVPRRASESTPLAASGSRGPRAAGGPSSLDGDSSKGKSEVGDVRGTLAFSGGALVPSTAAAAAGASPLHDGEVAGGGGQMVVAPLRDSGAMVAGDEGEVDEGEALDWDSVRCSYKCRNLVSPSHVCGQLTSSSMRRLRPFLSHTACLPSQIGFCWKHPYTWCALCRSLWPCRCELTCSDTWTQWRGRTRSLGSSARSSPGPLP